ALFLFSSCRKQIEPPPPPQTDHEPAAVSTAPDEPIQRLAWQAAQQIANAVSQGDQNVELQEVRNDVAWPMEAESYFLASLRNRLAERGVSVTAPSGLSLRGKLFHQNGRIVFAYTLLKDQSMVLSDSVAVDDNDRLRNTLAQFDRPSAERPATSLPNPLALLEQEPLDVAVAAKAQESFLLLLYSDRVDVLDWRRGTHKSISIPPRFASRVRSRAPSGKLIHSDNGFIILHNNLNAPLLINAQLDALPVLYTMRPAWLPVPDPGVNSFTLQDGRFFDFDPLNGESFAAVDTQGKLSLASGGNLISSAIEAGGTLAVMLPSIYTSSPSMPDKNDAIWKFSVKDRSLKLESSRPVDGQILDLLIGDLNNDGRSELIVTSRKSQGIMVEFQDLF
ncbi:MAG TPA: hypothetical protein VJ521_16380, partial [Acidobacteriota bacterium]|nr:hypothetical protein [Acidobacteriota bacterium]